MTVLTDVVSERRVRQALEELLRRAEETGQLSSVLALALHKAFVVTADRGGYNDDQ